MDDMYDKVVVNIASVKAIAILTKHECGVLALNETKRQQNVSSKSLTICEGH